MEKTKTEQVYINSFYAQQYNNGVDLNSDLTFQLERPIRRPKDTILAVRLDTLVLPISWTNINEYNNTITIDVDGAGDVDYVLDEGEYTDQELKDELNDKLGGDDFTITYSEVTKKYTITHATDEFVISSTSTLLRTLGFTQGVDHTSTGNAITSTGIVNLSSHINMVYVDIPSLSINNTSCVSYTRNASTIKTGIRSTILTSVPTGTVTTGIEYYQNFKQSYVYLQEDTVSSLRIRLLGEDMSTPINLYGADWLATFEFSFISTS